MEYDSIGFANVGPIEDGAVYRDKLSVFIGPNNSGKTIAARIIHGVCQTDEPPDAPPIPPYAAVPPGKWGANAPASAAHAMAIIRHAGLRPDAVPTQGKSMSVITVHGPGGSTRRFDLAGARGSHPARGTATAKDGDLDSVGRSAYMSADRAGGALHLLDGVIAPAKAAHVQNRLLAQMAGAVAEAGGTSSAKPPVNPNDVLSDPAFGDLFRRTGALHEAAAEAEAGGLDERAQETLSRLFPDSINAAGRPGPPLAARSDPHSRLSWIESAGSGVASLLPVVAGIHRVKKGGTCVIEEPGSHLEPQRQLILMDEILRIANEGRIGVVITTQSDFLVQKVLSLVSSGRLGQSELGLYYFRRPAGALTRIQRLRVDRTGEAEQEMFTRALDSLIAGF